jgi:hypothetical protein
MLKRFDSSGGIPEHSHCGAVRPRVEGGPSGSPPVQRTHRRVLLQGPERVQGHVFRRLPRNRPAALRGSKDMQRGVAQGRGHQQISKVCCLQQLVWSS